MNEVGNNAWDLALGYETYRRGLVWDGYHLATMIFSGKEAEIEANRSINRPRVGATNENLWR